MSDWRYVDAAEAAKLVRKALKREFGTGTKFYVTTSKYSGGASVSIHWIDGPTTKEVDAVVDAYKGGGFDGMIDMAYSKYSWLMPDGTATRAKSTGTTGSMGTREGYEYPKPHPDAELVSFGSDYIQTQRNESRALVEAVVKAVCERTGWDAPEVKDSSAYLSKSKSGVPCAYVELDMIDTDGHNEHFRRAIWKMSAKDGITPEALEAAVNAEFGVPFVFGEASLEDGEELAEEAKGWMDAAAAAELAEETANAVADVTKPDAEVERSDKFVWGDGDIVIEEPEPEPAPTAKGVKGNGKVHNGKFAK
jgi:hypothetical protein